MRSNTGQILYIPKIGQRADFQHPLMRGCLGWWPLTDGAGVIARDISGNGYNGTMTSGATFTSSNIGTVGFFDGVNDYCTTGSAALLVDGSVGSMSFWFKSNASQVSKRLFEFGSAATTGRSIGVLVRGTGEVAFRYRQSSVNYNVDGPTLASLGSDWNFAVATWDTSDNINLYINNIKYSSTRSGSINVGNLDRGYIAERALQVPLGEAFQGEIQNVRVYTRELLASEVSHLYFQPWAGLRIPISTKYFFVPQPQQIFPPRMKLKTSINVSKGGRIVI